MDFFDANAAFGRYVVPPLKQAETAAALREELDFCGIRRALVRHVSQEDECPTLGNRKLLDEARVESIMKGTPMHRYGEPEELVPAALLLLSAKAGSYLTGAAVNVDGGFTCSWF